MIVRATKYHRMKLAGKGKPTDGVKLSGDFGQRLQVDDTSGEGLYDELYRMPKVQSKS